MVREVGLALLTAGAVVLLFVVYELVGTNLSEEHSQATLARQFNSAVALPPAPVATSTTQSHSAPPAGRPGHGAAKDKPPTSKAKPGDEPVVDGVALPLPPPGGALDHLVIPAIGVDRYVVQGVDENDLQEGPGHYPGTPLPGQSGNVGIAGHRTTFGAPFFRLNELVPGDLIYLTDTSGTTWVYAVQQQWVVAPTDVAVLDPARSAELTLTTCNPRFEATSRLVVRASLADRLAKGTKLAGHLPVSITSLHRARGGTSPKATSTKSTKGQATTTGKAPRATTTTTVTPPTSAPVPAAASGPSTDSPTVGPAKLEQESLVTSDGWTWVAVLGWGLLALAGWVATRLVAARQYRYTKVLVLAAGALVCLVPLWFVFENAVDLLPSNL